MNDRIASLVAASQQLQPDGCCATWPKPCSYHEGYADGAEAMGGEVERLRVVLTALVDRWKGWGGNARYCGEQLDDALTAVQPPAREALAQEEDRS